MIYIVLLILLVLFFISLLFLVYCCCMAGRMLNEEMQDIEYGKENRKLSDRY